jgi:hypothetical protein
METDHPSSGGLQLQIYIPSPFGFKVFLFKIPDIIIQFFYQIVRQVLHPNLATLWLIKGGSGGF